MRRQLVLSPATLRFSLAVNCWRKAKNRGLKKSCKVENRIEKKLFFSSCPDGIIADSNFILEETKESRPPSDADRGETEILQFQSQQETGIVFFVFYMLKIATAKQMTI